jgi:predicted PurR-regulated permease PerM
VLWSLAALGALVLAKATAALTLPLLCAAMLFLLLSPACEALQRRSLSGGLAAAALVFVPLVIAGVLAWRCEVAATLWWRGTETSLANLAARIAADPTATGLARDGAGWLLPRLAASDAALAAWLGRIALPAALASATVAMLVFFTLAAQRSLLADLLRTLPPGRARVRFAGALRESRSGVSKWLGTLALVNGGLGLVTALALAALGWAGTPVWAIAISLLLFVPYLGPLLITALLAVGGAGSGSAALAAPAIFLVLHAVEAHFISPTVLGRRLRLARPAQLVAVLVGAFVWGLGGAVLAVPLLLVVRAGLRRVDAAPAWLALLAAERAAPSLAASATEAVVSRGADGDRVRRMPFVAREPTPCESPTSPKPTRPKSTGSR